MPRVFSPNLAQKHRKGSLEKRLQDAEPHNLQFVQRAPSSVGAGWISPAVSAPSGSQRTGCKELALDQMQTWKKTFVSGIL